MNAYWSHRRLQGNPLRLYSCGRVWVEVLRQTAGLGHLSEAAVTLCTLGSVASLLPDSHPTSGPGQGGVLQHPVPPSLHVPLRVPDGLSLGPPV